jgi:hypothetical protein
VRWGGVRGGLEHLGAEWQAAMDRFGRDGRGRERPGKTVVVWYAQVGIGAEGMDEVRSGRYGMVRWGSIGVGIGADGMGVVRPLRSGEAR